MNELTQPFAVALFAGHSVVASAGVLLSYKLREVGWSLGIIGLAAFAIAVVAAEWRLGNMVWSPTLQAFKLAIVVAVAGTFTGIAVTSATFEPETSEDDGNDGTARRPSRRSSDDGSVDIPGGLGED